MEDSRDWFGLRVEETGLLVYHPIVAVRPNRTSRPAVAPSIPAEAALSFLKDTKGALTWSACDLANSLKIGRPEAEQVIALLQAQGYVQPASEARQFMTTPSGETVSGAKTPRFTRESVEQALAALADRIKQRNRDKTAPFQIAEAVAFGDFLLADRQRVQAADVGIRLVPRDGTAGELRSAADAKAERLFLKELRGKTTHLSLRTAADWMSKRSHRSLLLADQSERTALVRFVR